MSPSPDRSAQPLTSGSVTAVELARVHLEELGHHSWWKALLNTLTGSYGSAQYRFVARRVGVPDRQSEHVAVGSTFPLMRFSDLGDESDRNGWSELARAALDELDVELRARGWRAVPATGPHWWSREYERALPMPSAAPTDGHRVDERG